MNSPNTFDQLNDAIDQIMAKPTALPADLSPEINELAEFALELRCLPRAAFKARLRADLERAAHGIVAPQIVDAPAVLPTLFGAGYGNFPVNRTNLAASFLLHAAAVALMLTSGIWMVQHHDQIKPQVTVSLLTDPSPYVLPPAPDKAGGGGGGGDRDKLPESKGTLPKFAREQFAAPAAVIRNEHPNLAVEPTVVGPPTLTFPQSSQMGNPLSSLLTASNGTGSGGGIGTGTGGGIGVGHGPGVGPGWGGGIGGGVYRVGGGVSAPRAIYDPEPEYSEEARKAKYQGSVVLWVIIDANGRPQNLRVQRSLGMGLDEKAIEAVRTWKFQPARKDGQPVAVQVNIEVNFRLY